MEGVDRRGAAAEQMTIPNARSIMTSFQVPSSNSLVRLVGTTPRRATKVSPPL